FSRAPRTSIWSWLSAGIGVMKRPSTVELEERAPKSSAELKYFIEAPLSSFSRISGRLSLVRAEKSLRALQAGSDRPGRRSKTSDRPRAAGDEPSIGHGAASGLA